MSLMTSGRRLNRHRWTKLPMPQDVIDRINVLARRQNGKRGLLFLDRGGIPYGDDYVAPDAEDGDNDDATYEPSDDDSSDGDNDYDSDEPSDYNDDDIEGNNVDDMIINNNIPANNDVANIEENIIDGDEANDDDSEANRQQYDQDIGIDL